MHGSCRDMRDSASWTKPHHAPQIPAVTPDKISAFNAIGAVPDCLAKARHGDGDASDRVLRFLTHLSAGICGESYVQVQRVGGSALPQRHGDPRTATGGWSEQCAAECSVRVDPTLTSRRLLSVALLGVARFVVHPAGSLSRLRVAALSAPQS